MAVDNRGWVSVRSLDDFAEVRNSGLESSPHWWPDSGPTADTGSLSFTHRMHRLGPITVLDIDFHDEVWVNGGQKRPHYHVTVPVGTPSAATDDSLSLVTKPGPVSVYRPEGSVRSLQLGFRHHLGSTPMAYLREVRLRRAHQVLLESDPSRITVASVACRWGFTNLGRFAAAHTARYQESPSETLRRSA